MRYAETGYNLGPWVCVPGETLLTGRLLSACVDRIEENAKVYVGLPAPNTCAFALLSGYGFKQYSKSIRMRLGMKIRDQSESIFAIAGPMKG